MVSMEKIQSHANRSEAPEASIRPGRPGQVQSRFEKQRHQPTKQRTHGLLVRGFATVPCDETAGGEQPRDVPASLVDACLVAGHESQGQELASTRNILLRGNPCCGQGTNLRASPSTGTSTLGSCLQDLKERRFGTIKASFSLLPLLPLSTGSK